MSLFPSAAQWKPTSGPLGIIDSANQSQSFFAPAGGGGGGGGGPNIAVSTLSFPTSGVINMNSVLQINDPTTAVIDDFFFNTNVPASNILSAYVSTANTFSVLGPGGDAANGVISLYGSDDGRGQISVRNASGSLSTLSITADNVNMPTNLQVSSINGQAPGGGGGGGPIIQVSTIQYGNAGGGVGVLDITATSALDIRDGNTGALSDIEIRTNIANVFGSSGTQVSVLSPVATNNLSVYAVDNGSSYISCPSTIRMLAQDVVTSSFTTSTVFATNALKVSGLGSFQATEDIIFNSDKTNVAQTDYRFYVSTQTFTPEGGSANSIAIFNPANDLTNTVILTSQQSGPGQLRCDGGLRLQAPSVSMSSLTVSSINGVAPGGGGSLYPVVSTIKPGGGGGSQTQYFTSTGASAQVLTAFSTQVGHNYMLSIPYTVSTFQLPVYGEAIQISPIGNGAQDLQFTQPLIQGGSWNFPISFKNKIADGGVAVLLTANTSYPVEVNLGDQDGAELVDLGPSQ